MEFELIHLVLAVIVTAVVVFAIGFPLGIRYRKRFSEKEISSAEEEARRIGDQIIAYQRCTGGWPKNIDMTLDMSQEELAAVIKEKSRRNDSTIDNNATTSQMTYLARLYRETKEPRYRDAFRAGVEYLLSGQYENGGWPQFWPEKRGYQYHITFNDDAMVNTLELLRSIMTEQQPYDKE